MTDTRTADTRTLPSPVAGLDRRPTALVAELRERFAGPFSALAEGAAGRDRERRHPYAEVRALAEAGFTRLRVPADHGGIDLSLADFFDLLADLGAADANVPNIVRGHFSFIEILRQMPDGPVRDHWFAEIVRGQVFGNGQTEPAPGPAAVDRARVSRGPGGWTVTGTKIYSSGTLHADAVRTSVLGPGDVLHWAIVPTDSPLVERIDDWDGFGQALSASGTTVFHEAPVPDLGVFPLGPGTRQHQSFVQIVHLATLAGIARRIRARARASIRASCRSSISPPSPG